MLDLNPGFDECLAEIDARLAAIQRDLGDPGWEPDELRAEAPAPQPAPQRPQPPQTMHRTGRKGPLADLLQRDPRPVPREQVPRSEPPPEPAEPPPRPEPSPPREPLAPPPVAPPVTIEALAQMQDKLGELLHACAGMLQASASVALSAGPFSSTANVKEFEQRLAQLPGVRDVTVRAYEGADRAVFDVRLS